LFQRHPREVTEAFTLYDCSTLASEKGRDKNDVDSGALRNISHCRRTICGMKLLHENQEIVGAVWKNIP
jgi:hypothetical protein